MSISTVPALPAHAATMDRNLVNVADMQTSPTQLPRHQALQMMSQTGANIHQGKMFNQMEDESFSEMKLFTNTKE